MPRALLSVSDKTGIVAFARALATRGYELISTGGTARTLQAADVAVTTVSDITGVPEMLDGRVKTLHPAVHGGILARRNRSEDLQALARHHIGLIDIVAVNLYPFVQAAANPATPFDELIEEIDIGGPSLVRAAAKNFSDVLVIVAPADYERVLEELDRPRGPQPGFRFELARRAFTHTAEYDAAIAATLATVQISRSGFARSANTGLPARLSLALSKIRDLRYGENPHQRAAWYASEKAWGLGAADVLQGKELSFTNLLDLDSAIRLVLEFDEPAASVVKHTNPCGVAIGSTVAEAYVRARDADSLAAFGGIVAVNRAIDAETATAITSTFIEAVIAPNVEAAALTILAAKPNLRVVVADLRQRDHDMLHEQDVRTLLGAALLQDRDRVQEAEPEWTAGTVAAAGLKVVTRRAPIEPEWRALRFAWRVCAHVKSNAVIFASDRETLAIGAGQMSRVDAVKVAVMKAGDRSLKGSVAASDAFFPFRDGLDALAVAGATAVVHPGGSVRDAEVIAAADEHGLAMVFTGRRHFRH